MVDSDRLLGLYGITPPPEVLNPFGLRYMQPHIYVGLYFRVETTWGSEIVSSWEAGPSKDFPEPPLAREVRHALRGAPRRPRERLERFYAALGRMVPYDPEVPVYATTPWLLGRNPQDVMDQLWRRYGCVLR